MLFGCEIAVDDALLVRGPQARGQASRQDAQVRFGHRTLLDPVGERDALDQFHHEIDAALVVAQQIVTTNDGGMADGEQRLGFAIEELRDALVRTEPGAHHLDRARFGQGAVSRAEDVAQSRPFRACR